NRGVYALSQFGRAPPRHLPLHQLRAETPAWSIPPRGSPAPLGPTQLRSPRPQTSAAVARLGSSAPAARRRHPLSTRPTAPPPSPPTAQPTLRRATPPAHLPAAVDGRGSRPSRSTPRHSTTCLRPLTPPAPARQLPCDRTHDD